MAFLNLVFFWNPNRFQDDLYIWRASLLTVLNREIRWLLDASQFSKGTENWELVVSQLEDLGDTLPETIYIYMT